MKSKTSFFNPTILKKNVTLFWPIWVCYLIYGLIKVPGRLWLQLQQNTSLTEYAKYSAVKYSVELDIDVFAIAVMAVVCGMALFGYLFTQKQAYMIHALPVTREELFFTNLLCGLAFLLIPQFLVFVVTVLLCLAKGIACVQFLAYWLISVMGISFFLFSTVCFCVMITGQIFALPVYFVAMNYIALAISYLVRWEISFLSYGIAISDVPEAVVLRVLSPINYITSHVRIRLHEIYDSSQEIVGGTLYYQGGKVLAAYVLAAVVFYALAYYGYKKRRIECAGDMLAFHWVRPVFRWGVGVCVGYFAGVLAAEFFSNVQFAVNHQTMYVLVAVFGIIGFFVAQMFVEKGFRVFHKKILAECSLFLLFVLGSFGAVSAGAGYLENYMPKESDITSAYIYLNYPSEYKGAQIADALDIQKEILERVNLYRNVYTDQSATVSFSYKLKNGRMVSRSYTIPMDADGTEKIGKRLRRQEDMEDNFMEYLVGDDYKKINRFDSGILTTDPSPENYTNINFDRHTAEKLYAAVLADVREGTVQKYNLINPLVNDDAVTTKLQSASLSIDFYHTSRTWKDIYQRAEDKYSQWGEDNTENLSLSGTAYLNFGKDCTHIIQTLKECGVIHSVKEIHFMAQMSE